MILKQTRTQCFAWALIPNHFHLLLRTGQLPIVTVMRRLLTGHAIRYNRRYKRHGHLFQNRYKFILCREDTYLLELVRYIHLNPLRAKLVRNLDHLDHYPFSGHGCIMGTHEHTWQNPENVLVYFESSLQAARNIYRRYMAQGIEQGKRNDLTGGGLVRSCGGWSAVKEQREGSVHMKSDERILGGWRVRF